MSDTYRRVAEVLEEAAKFAETHGSCTGHLYAVADREFSRLHPDFSFDKVECCCTDGAVIAAIAAKLDVDPWFGDPEHRGDGRQDEAERLHDLATELLRERLGELHTRWNDRVAPSPELVAKVLRDTACDAIAKATVAVAA